MLILKRTIDQSVQIGGDVFVRVLEVTGKSVVLGITAPDGTAIWRQEWTKRNPELAQQPLTVRTPVATIKPVAR